MQRIGVHGPRNRAKGANVGRGLLPPGIPRSVHLMSEADKGVDAAGVEACQLHREVARRRGGYSLEASRWHERDHKFAMDRGDEVNFARQQRNISAMERKTDEVTIDHRSSSQSSSV